MGRDVVLRDLEERDVESLVGYWHDSDPEFLASLGVDLNKRGPRERTYERFKAILNRRSSPGSLVLVLEADSKIVAYSNTNLKGGGEGVLHFHVLRDSAFVRGLAYLIFPLAVKVFFKLGHLTRITMQTAPENERIARFLDAFGLTASREFLDNPDGMARVGEFRVYEIAVDDELARVRPPRRFQPADEHLDKGGESTA